MKNKGFTLLEILVAIFIVAIIAVIMVRSLQTVLAAKDGLTRNNEQLAELTLTMNYLRSDISSIVSRPVLDNNGNVLPAFQLQDTDDHFLEFTRGNLANPLGERRSTLQRIGYKIQGGKLIRLTWDVLDRASTSKSQQRVLLTGIRDWKWSFLDESLRNYSFWPPKLSDPSTLPIAVQISVFLKDQGEMTQIFPVAAHHFIQDASKK